MRRRLETCEDWCIFAESVNACQCASSALLCGGLSFSQHDLRMTCFPSVCTRTFGSTTKLVETTKNKKAKTKSAQLSEQKEKQQQTRATTPRVPDGQDSLVWLSTCQPNAMKLSIRNHHESQMYAKRIWQYNT